MGLSCVARRIHCVIAGTVAAPVRSGILAVGAYFVVGLILLVGIDVERGRRAALAAA